MASDLGDGAAESEGDPRVLFVVNVVLSSVFVALALTLGSVAGITEFTLLRFLALTAVLVLVTHLATR